MWARWYGPIVERFRAWAADEPALRAALVIGSQARTDHPADEWSDLDLVIFHNNPEQLIASTDWVRRFGDVVLTTVEPTAVLGSRERRVLYADGKDVDFAVFPSAALGSIAQSPEGLAILQRGYEVLLDKDAQLSRPVTLPKRRRQDQQNLPSEEQFQATVADFWYHVPWAGKKLRRGELWTAKMVCDGYLKLLLVQMIEWQTIVRRGNESDVWHDGRFLDSWAEPDVRARLPGTFATYDSKDLARALTEMGKLFSDMAREVAKSQRWSYAEKAESTVLEILATILKDGSGSA